MWKCPVCGAETPTVTICAQCGFDGSRDYEHYPTVSKVANARSIQALRAEWERQKQPQPQNGANLYHTVTITPELAATGCQVTVPRPDGTSQAVFIPANHRNGGLLRCAGQGYSGQNGGQNGDMLITVQVQSPVSPAQAQPVQPPAAPSQKKAALIVSICSVVIILVLFCRTLIRNDTPAADTSSGTNDITVPEVVVQDPGIANCKVRYVDWYSDEDSYALALTMAEDSDAETVTVEQLQAMIDEEGCTTLVVQQFDNADGAMWQQIGKLTGIERLCIDYCTASDLELLSGMRDLKWLAINISRVDLTGVSALTNLTRLSIDTCNIGDISPLSGLKNLQYFYSRKSYISDLSPLSGLTQLTSLSIQNFPSDDPNMQITDLSPLSNLTQLTTLALSYNKFTDVTPLANLTRLTTLDLSYNKIIDISPLANLTELTTLRLNGNEISDWSPLANLTKLETLEPDVQIGG